MKTPYICAILAITSMTLFGQSDPFKIPGQWDQHLILVASHTGSMSGGSTIITFTHDSCTYKIATGRDAPVEKKFPLSAGDRSTILKKLQDLKVNGIKGASRSLTQNDGWSHSICFGLHCIEAGSGADLSEEDMNKFIAAYSYLEDFAREGKNPVASTEQMKSYELPTTWDKNFVIYTESVDNQRGGTVKARFTYDSCFYSSSTTRDPKLKNKKAVLSQADRDAILAKLRELQLESIKSPAQQVQPAESIILLCVGNTCIDAGSATTLNEKDRKIFLSGYRFLNDFAIKK